MSNPREVWKQARLNWMLKMHPNKKLNRHIILGHSPFGRGEYPYPIDLLTEGMLILAAIGSGKSSRIIGPLIAALAAQGISTLNVRFKESGAERENIRIAAEENGMEYSYLTTQEGCQSHCLNPIQSLMQFGAEEMTTALRAVLMTTMLGLDFGKGYGQTHFHAMDQAVLQAILRPDILPPEKQTIADAAKLLFDPDSLQLPGIYKEALREAGADIFIAKTALASKNIFNNRRGIDPGRHLDFEKFFLSDERTMIDMEIPVGSSPEDAYLAGQTAVGSASYYLAKMPSSSTLRKVVIIDDAEPIFSQVFSQLLHVARSKGVGFIISIQGKHQAANGKQDFYPSLEAYAATKVFMGIEDLETFDYINKTAGRVRRPKFGWKKAVSSNFEFEGLQPDPYLPTECHTTNPLAFGQLLETISVQMVEESRFEGFNEIMLASARGDMAFIRIRKDSGLWCQHGRMIPVRLFHHITPEEYARRSNAKMPHLPDSVIVKSTDVISELFKSRLRAGDRLFESWKRRDNRDRNRPRPGDED